jgi:hypothetical protein
MTTSSLTALVNAYATACGAALATLENEMSAAGADGKTRLRPIFDSRNGGVDPVKVAIDSAAKAIFAAESAFGAGALKAVAEAQITAGQVVELHAAGNSILMFAAVAFRAIVGSEFLTNYTPGHKLKELAERPDRVQISHDAALLSGPLTARLTAPMAPSPSYRSTPRRGGPIG